MRDYQHMVFASATRLTGSEATGADIAQEVFIRAWEHFDELRDRTGAGAGAGGWLKTVTLRLALNHTQRHGRRWRPFSDLLRRTHDADEDGDDLEVTVAALDDLFATTEAGQRATLVQAALARLPDAQRIPLVLFHYEEQSYQQIAASLEISVAKVKTDILRGRQALARRLEGTDLATPASGVAA